MGELEAARTITVYAALPATDDETAFKHSLANLFCAETVANVRSRLGGRPSAYGLEPTDFAGFADTFLDRHLAPQAVVDLGETIRRRHGRLPDDHWDGEKALIRDTFRRFAEAEVMPAAEVIHRVDTMIPDGIIDGLRALGCFGLSVPARYGGLRPDDDEDSLGMVVVTEELSRGSPGAAESLITRPEIMARAVLEGGIEAQKARWLPGIAAGDLLVAISVAEPGTGSDVASVALRALPASEPQDGWVLRSAKTWCTFAGRAGVILVLAASVRIPFVRQHPPIRDARRIACPRVSHGASGPGGKTTANCCDLRRQALGSGHSSTKSTTRQYMFASLVRNPANAARSPPRLTVISTAMNIHRHTQRGSSLETPSLSIHR